MRNKHKVLVSTFSAMSLLVAGALLLSTHNVAFLRTGASYQPYTLTLDSNNKYSGGSEQTYYVDNHHWQVTFTYSNATSVNNNHASLSQNGYIVNKTQITSITSVNVSFTGSLKISLSYEGSVFSDPVTISSGVDVETNSPYFVKLENTGSSNAVISSITYSYSCSPNPTAEEAKQAASQGQSQQETTLVDTLTSNETGVTGTSYTDWTVTNSEESVFTDATYKGYTAGQNNTIQIRTKNSDSGIVTSTSGGTIKKVSVEWNSNTQNGRTINVYGSNSAYSDPTDLFTSSKGDLLGSITYGTSTEIVVEGDYAFVGIRSNKDPLFMDSISFTWSTSASVGPDIPTPPAPTASEIGFTASLSKTEYYSDETFDTSSITTTANMSDNTQQAVNYTGLTVKDVNDNTIDITKTFENNPGYEDGTYTVIVEYKNFVPYEFQIHLSTRTVVTDIDVNTNKLSYTTADTLDISSISAIIHYNNIADEEVSYTNFASKDLTMTLYTPNQTGYSVSSPFGTSGTWTIKIVLNSDTSKFGSLKITVNSIPVETISVTASSAEVEVGKTLQLTATVSPTNATNQSLTWTSSNTSVATVNNSGLVTAVETGTTTITATSQDGSAVYGTITITVTPKTTGASEGVFTLSTSSTLTVGSYVVFASTYEGTGYTMSKTQNTNNRPGVSTTITNSTIERDSNSDFAAFRVEEGTTSGTYSFYDEENEGYLYAASSSSNQLKTESAKTANSSFAISGSESKTITAQGSNSRNSLRWNTNSTLFSCYSSGQSAPYIFEKSGDPIYATSISLSGADSVSVGGTTTLSVSFNPSETNVKAVSWSSSNDTIISVEDGVVTGIKAGSATITASVAGANNTTISAQKTITCSNIAVSSVSLNKSTASLSVGETTNLVATINPSNATNKTISWSTSDNSVAVVDGGTITAIGAGTATITVTTSDGGKTASCTVNVTSSGGTQSDSTTYTISPSDFTTSSYANNDGNHTAHATSGSESFGYYTKSVYQNSSTIQMRGGSGYLYNTEALSLLTISFSISAGSPTVYGSNTESGQTTSITPSAGVYNLSNYSYFRIDAGSSMTRLGTITITTGALEEIDPTSIAINPSSFQLAKNGSRTLSVNYTPNNANHNKAVTWTSSNTNVATVDTSGKVTVSNTATTGTTVTITAKLTSDNSIKATSTLTIIDQQNDDSTVLLYICGADLESGKYRLASGDISEILSVSGQPSNVNVVIETGGAKSWASTHGISASYLQRHHVENKSLVTDQATITYASMGLTSTLQSFIEYGLENYPADRTSLILWNHGGGMRGVCYDEKKNDDTLLDYEVKNAVSNALSNKGMSGQKLEWIGYDACLMQVQDIAEMNSPYFNYMVASEESEAGEGWDYDTWIDDLYAKKDTSTTLKAIVDGFIADNGGVNSSSNDQTLSYLDLSYASAYKSAWENMAKALTDNKKITSSNKSSFNTLVKGCKYYADTDYTYFGLFDAKDFINKLAASSTFNPGSTYTNAVLNAHGNLVAYSSCGRAAGNSYGLAMYWSAASDSGKSTYYTSSHTNFSNWRGIVSTYGA